MFSVLAALLAIASDGAYVLIVGLLLAKSWLRDPWLSDSWLGGQEKLGAPPVLPFSLVHQPLVASAMVLALAHAVKPWTLAASMSGLTRWKDITPLIPEILGTTRLGTLWYIDAAAIAVLLATIVLWMPARSKAPANWSATACLVLIGFVKAASGHAAADGDFTIREAVQVLHILATAVWAGAVLASGLLILPRLSRLAEPGSISLYGGQLSEAATTAVILILASGIYTADRELNNSLSGLWHSSWGIVLSVKLIFVLLALSLGSYNRFVSLKKMKTAEDSIAFARVTAAEAIMMAIIVCLSGVLGSLAPAALAL